MAEDKYEKPAFSFENHTTESLLMAYDTYAWRRGAAEGIDAVARELMKDACYRFEEGDPSANNLRSLSLRFKYMAERESEKWKEETGTLFDDCEAELKKRLNRQELP